MQIKKANIFGIEYGEIRDNNNMTIPTCPKCNTKTSEESQRWVQTDGWGE